MAKNKHRKIKKQGKYGKAGSKTVRNPSVNQSKPKINRNKLDFG